MSIREELRNTYKFYNPDDTNKILYELVKKKAEYKFNQRRRRKERKHWWFENVGNFLINPNLLFGRIFPYSEQDEREEKDKYLGLVIKEKDKYLELVIKEMEKINTGGVLNKILERRDLIIKTFEKEDTLRFKELSIILDWRMVIGLGASHPQETSMTLHHIYGIPYIPGSAVKGVTRHWVILSKFENKENEAEENLEFQRIFGTQDKKGEVIFFDAYPVGEIKLKIDIMNPHYPDYYGKDKPPADWQNPNPIKFLTVEKTKFRFYLASKDNELLQKAEECLKEALKESGIGAKTSLGYGVFDVV